MPRERIVELPAHGQLLAGGPDRSVRAVLELYLDRGLDFGERRRPPRRRQRALPRVLEPRLHAVRARTPVNTLTPLPAQNIDTGLGLNRMAAILQGDESVFETDQFQPLIELGEQLSRQSVRRRTSPTTRALRILADHARAMTFLVADGVVPSNEDRGYILRRVMRRAIQQGRALGIEPGFLPRFAAVRRARRWAAPTPSWPSSATRSRSGSRPRRSRFGRTLEQGTKLLDDLIAQREGPGRGGPRREDVFQLHDTYGFPYRPDARDAAEHDLGVDEPGFEQLMERAARAGARRRPRRGRRRAARARAGAGHGDRFASAFTGYETTEQATSVGAVEREDGRAARQARRVALLRGGRRPGVRHRLRRVRRRRLPRARRAASSASPAATTRCSCSRPRSAS